MEVMLKSGALPSREVAGAVMEVTGCLGGAFDGSLPLSGTEGFLPMWHF